MKFAALLLAFGVSTHAQFKTTSVPTSCTSLEDGDYLLKLIDDDSYPLVYATCSNGYAIIDYNKDDSWIDYLTSWREYYYAVRGPEKDDHVTWKEWYKVTSDDSVDADWLVSPSCDVCDETSKMQYVDTDSTYHMLTEGTDCVRITLANEACDVIPETYQCQLCSNDMELGKYTSLQFDNGIDWDSNDEDALIYQDDYEWESILVGTCPFTVFSSTTAVMQSSDMSTCMTVGYSKLDTLKPSIGSWGNFCQCVKTADETTYVEIDDTEIATKEASLESTDEEETTDPDAKYYLYQSDFSDGTYIISKPGTYIVMEDITFDFKSGFTDASEVEIDAAATSPALEYSTLEWWWPTEEDSDRYEGAGGLVGPYHLGFFAGISVETNDVTLDLGGYTLEQSLSMYYQQSFFANIALVSQTFLPWQGIGPFGSNPTFAERVTIKNGVLGLSSHFGIQGHYNKEIVIENMQIKDFKTHGIQMSGFNGLTIRDVEIGPNMAVEKTTVWYSHMRHLLPTFEMMATDEAAADACVDFANRDTCVTMADLVAEVKTMLDMAFEYAVFDKDWDAILDTLDDDVADLWTLNKDAFVSNGYPNTATLYGLFLNYPGANVIQWYTNNQKSYDATIENVYIHDLVHNSEEGFVINARTMLLTGMGAPLNAMQVFGSEFMNNNYNDDDFEPSTELKYIGNVVTDVQIMQYHLVQEYDLTWYYVHAVSSNFEQVRQLAVYDNNSEFDFSEGDGFGVICGQDKQIHPGKGILGMRVNGVSGLTVNNLKIENLRSETQLGSELCGDYLDGTTLPTHQPPYLHTYQLNYVNGMSITYSTIDAMDDVTIRNLESYTGGVFALAVWYSTESIDNFGSQITIENVNAGTQVEKGTLSYTTGPNIAPEACAVRVYDSEGYATSVNNKLSQDWILADVDGHVGCGGTDDTWTTAGNMKTTSGIATLSHSQSKPSKKVMKHQSSKPESVQRLQSSDAHTSKSSSSVGLLSNKWFEISAVVVVAMIAIGLWLLSRRPAINKSPTEIAPLLSDEPKYTII